MTVKELLTAALREIGVSDPHVTPTAIQLQNALEKLNTMLDSWALDRVLVYVDVKEELTLTASQTHTWGTSGTITTTRPLKIHEAFVREDSVDYPVEVLNEEEYNRISSKLTTGRPTAIFYRPTYPLGVLYIYPVQAATMWVISQKPWSSMTSLTSDVSFPPGYNEALKYNLALRLVGEYGKTLTQEVVAMAVESREKVIRMNFSNSINPVQFGYIPGLE